MRYWTLCVQKCTIIPLYKVPYKLIAVQKWRRKWNAGLRCSWSVSLYHFVPYCAPTNAQSMLPIPHHSPYPNSKQVNGSVATITISWRDSCSTSLTLVALCFHAKVWNPLFNKTPPVPLPPSHNPNNISSLLTLKLVDLTTLYPI